VAHPGETKGGRYTTGDYGFFGGDMRLIRPALAAALGAALLTGATVGVTSAGAAGVAGCSRALAAHAFQKGYLTVATDNPAYSPWFINNKPANGKGYESAVVYALAKAIGVSKSKVKWVTEPFDASYAPGPKSFDFDINEISYTAQRAQAVSFSSSYYDVQQSIVALKTDKIAKAHSPAQLRTYVYGDQIGTTGLAYINEHIKPTTPARVYSTLDQAVQALKLGQIDALVIDTPTGQYMASSQITGSGGKANIAVQVGQFPSVGEHYGLLLQKGSALLGCVNAGIASLRAHGTLAALAKRWLGIYTSVPVIKP
jgi:polar amino acid transport system substrate-binding protein